jgi:hypothetical protein
MVNLPTQQLSPVPRTNALLLDAESIAVHAFRRVVSPCQFLCKVIDAINTWSATPPT